MSRYDDCIEKVQALSKLSRQTDFLMGIWGSRQDALEGVPGDDPGERRATKYAALSMYKVFDLAEPYYVDVHLQAGIEAAAPALPLHTRLKPEMFPTRYGCLFFSEPVKNMPPRRIITDESRGVGNADFEPAPLSGFAWQVDDAGVVLIFLYSWAVDTSYPTVWRGYDVSNVPLIVMPWNFATATLGSYVMTHNERLRKIESEIQHYNAERFSMSAGITVATLLLMSQTLTQTSHVPVDRHARRRAIKAGWGKEPSVRVVKLRRIEYTHSAENETQHIDWQHRWWVSPHWRTLHRGTQEERTVFIPRYVKGPADKPFKPANQRVFAVVR